ncbi:putative E3 ubiquitin-protein ligase RHY1A [Senna tora]|uniref:RING-type E3 ubiquitin transferase n=1 Tax=Senna tora TaxID=362788 RepID=A0A834SLD7_9FABA|nr:putative E3 ubiquitin-protein ligase RHY1A [Senna tora]
MAGMLPGVECARRRRFHVHDSPSSSSSSSITSHASTRRSSFCLYTTSHESLPSSSSLLQRSFFYQAYPDEMLGGAAREARERLDERLRAQTKSLNKRESKKEKLKCEAELKSSSSGGGGGSRRFKWSKMVMKWKSSEQEDCAVCLESFKEGDTLTHLPCAHRFHSTCVQPWLHNNAHCPCCRINIFISH